MKNIFGFVLILTTFAACKEEPPFINYEESKQFKDTTYIVQTIPAAQPKNVLLEDISGVKCVNCPDAAVIAKGILAAFPGRAFTTVMHPDLDALANFVSPITKPGHESKFDFRTKDASDILQLVGIPGALPQGYVNRKKFAGQSSRILGRADWYGKCQEELQGTTPVNIELKDSFIEATHEGFLTIKLTFTQTVNRKQMLSIMLVEDSLVDVQEYQSKTPPDFPVVFDDNYVHMHVLRDLITSATGEALTTDDAVTLTAGRVFEKQYKYTTSVSSKITVNPKHAKLLVVVHDDTQTIDVTHVQEIHVGH